MHAEEQQEIVNLGHLHKGYLVLKVDKCDDVMTTNYTFPKVENSKRSLRDGHNRGLCDNDTWI